MLCKVTLWMSALSTAVLVSGCYTVLRAPRTATLPVQEQAYASEEVRPAISRYSDEDDFDRYPGGVYGYGDTPYGGTPYLGYDTGAGFYGYGAYGYGPYGYGAYGYPSYGYGPYGYGADPYYHDSGGSYLAPGYELISTRELENIRDTIDTLSSSRTDPVQEARQEELWREAEEERERVFQTHLSPSRTRTIKAAPYVPPPAPTVQKASGSSGSSRDTSVNSSSSSAKKSGDSGKKDIKSKSKRRRGR